MSNSYPYPPVEHYEFPQTVSEYVADEIRFSQNFGEFAPSVTLGLGRVYGRTELLQTCQKLAALLKGAQDNPEHRQRLTGLDPDFYAGEVLGVHSVYQACNSIGRTRLLYLDFWQLYGITDQTTQEEYEETLNTIIDDVVQFRSENWKHQLRRQSTEFQNVLVKAAVRMYETQEKADASEEGFLAGYFYAANLLISYMEASSNTDNEQ